jgi:hypothetical protein
MDTGSQAILSQEASVISLVARSTLRHRCDKLRID